jgi:hypothetical protein
MWILFGVLELALHWQKEKEAALFFIAAARRDVANH